MRSSLRHLAEPCEDPPEVVLLQELLLRVAAALPPVAEPAEVQQQRLHREALAPVVLADPVVHPSHSLENDYKFCISEYFSILINLVS